MRPRRCVPIRGAGLRRRGLKAVLAKRAAMVIEAVMGAMPQAVLSCRYKVSGVGAFGAMIVSPRRSPPARNCAM